MKQLARNIGIIAYRALLVGGVSATAFFAWKLEHRVYRLEVTQGQTLDAVYSTERQVGAPVERRLNKIIELLEQLNRSTARQAVGPSVGSDLDHFWIKTTEDDRG